MYKRSSKTHRELPVYNHINSLHSLHGGESYIRRLLDNFEVQGPNGIHLCLVHEALGIYLEEFQGLVPDCTFEPDLVRQSLRSILRALHFLHTEAGIVHTGQ
jgi:hypothetical protein